MVPADFEPLFRSNFNKLCHVANKIIQNKEAAKDIVQDVFLRVWNKQQDLSAYSAIEGYLHKATINASLNYLESRKNVVPLSGEILTAQRDDNDRFALKELENRINRAIDKLPPQCKTIFVLSRFEGMKYQQIADYLNISVKTVENQMGKALRELRDDLRPYLGSESVSMLIFLGISMLIPYFSLLILLKQND